MTGGDRVAAVAQQQRVEDEEGENDVGERAGDHDRHALPDIFVHEQMRLHARPGIAATACGSGMLAAFMSPTNRT